MASVELQKATKKYKDRIAIDCVSVVIEKNERVAIIGPNGAGKSTLLRLVAGDIYPDSGDVLLNGRSTSKIKRSEIAYEGLAVVYQDGGLCPEVTILENLFLGCELTTRLGFVKYQEMRVTASNVMDYYQLPKLHLGRKAGELSGGQQRLVAIARALIRKPGMLLLDEPTAFLGIAERRALLDLLLKLQSAGIGMAICTHLVDEVQVLASRVVAINEGKIAIDSPASSLTRSDLLELMSGAHVSK